MEVHECIRVAVTRLLVNDVDGFAVEVEGQDFREGGARAVDAELEETRRQRWWCAHDIPANPLERVFVHCDKRTEPPPPRVAFRMRSVSWRNHDIANGRLRVARKDAVDFLGACGRRQSDKQSAVGSNRGDHISGASREHKHCWPELSDADSFL